MEIIIIGGGLGGLTAAYRFAQTGHCVHVLERSAALAPKGGGLNIRPNASRLLISWGLGPDFDAISSLAPQTLLRSRATGELTMRNVATDASEFPDWGMYREDVMRILYRKSVDAGARVLFGHTVVDVEDDECDGSRPVVRLGNGARMSADMVLVADGIKSRLRSKVLADLDCPKDPIVSNFTFYGINVDERDLVSRSGTERLMEQTNINVWMGTSGYVVTRHNKKRKQVSGLFGVINDTDQKSLWDQSADISIPRQFFAKDCNALTQALAAAKSCDRWRLAELPNLPRWTSRGGRVLLLGDAAHGMHPSAAQGFSMIIEDIAVLEFLLSSLKGRNQLDIPQISDMWQAIRKARVERIKAYAVFNTEIFSTGNLVPSKNIKKSVPLSLKSMTPDMHAHFNAPQFTKWSLDYDALAEVRTGAAVYTYTSSFKHTPESRPLANFLIGTKISHKCSVEIISVTEAGLAGSISLVCRRWWGRSGPQICIPSSEFVRIKPLIQTVSRPTY